MSQKGKAFSLKEKFEILKEFDKCTGLIKVELAKHLDISVSILKIIVMTEKKLDSAAACRNSKEIECTRR